MRLRKALVGHEDILGGCVQPYLIRGLIELLTEFN